MISPWAADVLGAVASPPEAVDSSLDWAVFFVGSAVVAALLSGSIAVFLAVRSNRLEERARVRTAFAEAFQACAEYREFPYAIRRRRADQPGEERVRLSESLRGIQARLSYYHTWIETECAQVGAAYYELVRQQRIHAGGAMKAAWNSPAAEDDLDMNIGRDVIDLSVLAGSEKQFVDAALKHIDWAGSVWRWRHSRRCPNFVPIETAESALLELDVPR